jgi:hypothetical protein
MRRRGYHRHRQIPPAGGDTAAVAGSGCAAGTRGWAETEKRLAGTTIRPQRPRCLSKTFVFPWCSPFLACGNGAD